MCVRMILAILSVGGLGWVGKENSSRTIKCLSESMFDRFTLRLAFGQWVEDWRKYLVA